MGTASGESGLTPPRAALSFAILTVAGIVLTGWVLHQPMLKAVLPGLTTMKANTALGLVCLALAALLADNSSAPLRRTAAGLAVIAGGLGLATLVEYLCGVKLGIDELLFADPDTTSRPFNGRMSPATATAFVAAGVSLLLLSLGRRTRTIAAGHGFAAIPAGVGFLSLTGYAYGVEPFYRFGPYISVALNTASCLSLLSIALVLTRAKQGWARGFIDAPIARMALRRISVLAIVLPFTTGLFVVLGIREGYYQGLFASALFAVAAAGALLWLAFSSATILARAEGEVAAARSLAQRTAGELESSLTRHRTLVEGLPQLVWTCDADGRRDYLSPQWYAYAGVDPAERPDPAWVSELVHPEDLDAARGAWAGSVTAHEAYDVEIRLRRGDGAYRWFKSRGLRVGVAGAGYWLGTCTDIQESVEAREVLARSQAELEGEIALRIAAQGAAEALRRTAFETSRIFQALFGLDARVLEVNAAALSTIGAAAPDVVGRSFTASPWFAATPGQAERVDAVLRAVADGATVREELVLDLATGRRAFDFAFEPIRDPSGDVIAVMAEAVELTERRAAEAQLIAAREAAEQAAKAEADFLANMSHELRTPLNSIVGFSGLVAEAPELQAETRRRAKLVQASSQSLVAVVNDILDFSKLEAEGVHLALEPVELESLLVSTADLVRGEADARGVRLAIHILHSGPARMLDAARLRQVLFNLLSNAIKFTREGTVTVSLAQTETGALKIAVRDTGIGIAADKLEHIFQRFAQANGSISRNYGGTGLGLAISRTLITAMGGEMRAESVEGQGSCFWFTLDPPVADPAAVETVAADIAGPLATGRRVLLVDDNALNRELFCAMMRALELDIVEAESGAQAVSAVAEGRFDIVFMDIQMPEMDGVEATRRIRAAGHAELPIVALTANVMDRQIAGYLEAGMSDHVAKPMTAAAIAAALARWPSRIEAAPAVDEAPMAEANDSGPLRDLRDAIGQEGVNRFLDGLCGQLDGMLALLSDSTVSVERIQEVAHSVRGLAGSLGLVALFDDYTALELACAEGGPLETVRTAAEASTRANMSALRRMMAA